MPGLMSQGESDDRPDYATVLRQCHSWYCLNCFLEDQDTAQASDIDLSFPALPIIALKA